MKIGVLSVQGDVQENVDAVRRAIKKSKIKGDCIPVKTVQEIDKVDGLVIPGGESTTIGGLCQENGVLSRIKERIISGMPVLGICAGLVLLSGSVTDRCAGATGQPLLGCLDVTVRRNSFGRQAHSFERAISLEKIGIQSFNGVFIRAPSISQAGPGVEVLAKLGDDIVAVKKDKMIATAFHPELAGDLSVHRHFLGLFQTGNKYESHVSKA